MNNESNKMLYFISSIPGGEGGRTVAIMLYFVAQLEVASSLQATKMEVAERRTSTYHHQQALLLLIAI